MYIHSPLTTVKTNLLKILEQVGVREQMFITSLRKKGITSPFTEDNWSLYMQLIIELQNKYPPCPICGSPQIQNEKFIKTRKNPRGITCVLFPIHALLPDGNDETIRIHLGKKCKHQLYMAECHECIQITCMNNIIGEKA